jgi:hypothetical protein
LVGVGAPAVCVAKISAAMAVTVTLCSSSDGPQPDAMTRNSTTAHIVNVTLRIIYPPSGTPELAAIRWQDRDPLSDEQAQQH